jgi:dienelactone hydrolase
MASGASATVAQTLTAESRGKIEFAAPTFGTLGEFARGVPSGSGKATLDIHLPEGEGPFPAVIVGHNVGGWNDLMEGDALRRLLAAGYAVGGIDHFTPRGLREAASGGFSPPTAFADALLALRLLSSHPRVDGRRIGVLGFSMGGMTALSTAFEPIRQRYAGDARFAAHVGFYAPCGTVALDGPRTMTGAPILLLYGGKDETTPRALCDQIASLLRETKPDLALRTVWYADAYHAWNNSKAATPKFFPGHRSTRACPLIDFGARFGFIRADGTREAFVPATLTDCLRKGAGYSLGYSASVTEQSWAEALAFLAEHLKK